jgi:tetratricopeptide (TPR) repeat protein
MRSLLVAALLVSSVAAPAHAFDDPDTEIARRHFELGRSAYDARDYRKALDEFLAAKRAKAAPALDYNIARCYDRLEDYPLAIKHYEIYVAGKPSITDQIEVNERIRTLRKRVDEIAAMQERHVTPPPKPPVKENDSKPLLIKPPSFDDAPIGITPPPKTVQINQPSWDEARARRRRNIGIAVGVVTGVAVIAGAVALGVVLGQSGPPPPITPSQLGPKAGTE